MTLIRAWNRFWFAPTSARPLGALRILFGLIVLLHVGLLANDCDEWLSNVGRLQGSEARELAGWFRPSLLFWFQDPISIRIALALTAAAAVLFSLGWHTRIMGIIQYVMIVSIHHRNILTLSGADTLLVIITFYLMLSPCGAALSLDHRRRVRKLGAEFEPLISPWPQRLIQIQITIVYFMTAVLKAKGSTWHDGTALYYVLSNVEFRRFTFGVTSYPLLINLMTYAAVVIEFCLAFLLWVKAARPWVILAGLTLHGGIMLTVNIPVFGELITACYLAFLLPEEFDTLCRRLDPRGWMASRERAAIPGRVDAATGVPRPHKAGKRVASKA